MVSQATTKALQSIADNQGILELLLIDHSSFASPIRVVNDTRDWVIGSDTYVGLPFVLKLPSQVKNENPRATLQLDNVGRDFTAALEALPAAAALTATVRLVSRATPQIIDFEFIGQLTSINVNQTSVSCSFGLDDVMRQSAVRLRFDPFNSPALFAG